MTPLFKKLNWKGQEVVYLLQAPADLTAEWTVMQQYATFKQKLTRTSQCYFILAFCTSLQQVEQVAALAGAALQEDGLLWVAYPKGSSKKYTCEFNRDTGWASLGRAGFEPVRQVAIDADWSALRFRRVEYIKKMTRGFAMTEAGKEKVRKGSPPGS
ncbi:MAG TPA: hypothetical protein PKE63_02105 [Lacibacter sp.]|nr:hypothetical protein [Lacibacter sp.]HMO87595.1 hypothetical protein [Lacibacter sp.]HMP86038.1 hypothetical protein [Lacibacter sp.]